MEFGGLGGIRGGRARRPDDLFEATVDRLFGERLRAEGEGPGWATYGEAPTFIGQRLWGSLANVEWRHDNGDTASYSFRAAGDMIAAVVGAGDYMDWYCSAPDGNVDAEIAEALAKEGWRPFDVEWPDEALT